MGKKREMSSVVAALLVLAMVNILPIDGQSFVCPWCEKGMQRKLLSCVYVDMATRPELMSVPLQALDSIKVRLESKSDSMSYMPHVAKKVAMDEEFVSEMANVIKEFNFQNNPAMIQIVSEMAGNCYSSVTGYNKDVVTGDVKKLVNDNIRKSTPPLRGDLNPVPYSGMPYSANQKQPSNLQSYQPPPNPFSPPLYPDETSYPPNAANNYPIQKQPPMNDYGYQNNPNLQTNLPVGNAPGSSPVNNFDNNAPGSSPVNNFDNNAPGSSPVNNFDKSAPVSSPLNLSNNPYVLNNAPGPSKNWPFEDHNGQRKETSDFSRNQATPGGAPGTFLQNDNKSPSNKNSPDTAVFTSTASPKISSPPQNSKSSDSDSSNGSAGTTPSPSTGASKKKTTENKKSGDEKVCDENFKIALYETLINDARFHSVFGKHSHSATKSFVLKIMKLVFKKYGIQERFTDFSDYFNFESKTLTKESGAEDWDEIISKSCKVIFSRHDLLNGECAEIGRTIADYFLGETPGGTPASSTDNPNQNDGSGKTSTESNTNSSVQKENPNQVSNSTTNASPESKSNSGNSTNSGNLSFPEVHSKLKNMFKHNDNVPFSEMLSAFEAKEDMETLHRAADSCKTPTGFNFDKFFEAMTNVTDSIQKNHPDWSRDQCEKEMYTETVAVLVKELSDEMKSSSNNTQSTASSNKADSAVDSNNSQNSNSGPESNVPNDYNLSSDDSTYTGPGIYFDSGPAPQPQQDFENYGDYPDAGGPVNIPQYGNQPNPGDYNRNAPQPQQDFANYGGYPDGGGPVNIPQYGNQPSPGDWNGGLKQPSNFAPGPVNSNYGSQPYKANYDYPDYGNQFPQPSGQNYPAIPPASMDTQPNYGPESYPVSPNARFQQPSNFAPDSGVLNPPNGNYGNNPYQLGNLDSPPAASPVLPNGNSQNFQQQPYQDYNSGVPATQNVQQQPYQDYNSGVPATGPAIPNGNNQQQFNPNYNSRYPDYGPAIPKW